MATTRSVPRWTIMLIDLGLCVISLVAAYQLRFNFQVPATELELLLPVLPWFLGVRLLSFVRVIWAGINFELAIDLSSKSAFWEHAPDCVFNESFRFFCSYFFGSLFF